MKRLHLHVAVDDLSDSIRFYSALFDAKPSVTKDDYAKWMLDDPRVNFAISKRAAASGLDHVGIQVETPEELREVYARLQTAGGPVLQEGETTCCYAKSEKSWIADPQGLLWETFLTTGESAVYGDDPALAIKGESACCTPATPQGACCASKPERAPDAPCCG
ncbi:MAG: glyoxalase/bleomycin resistance/dioxygenase family protein [Alphaproteobacteria bacterium]|nr:glyoxalase/bleomycin resistance/dioxygenase family protein [Alphaproteobacteria bacterium]MBM3652264.1 glyoxalase/bleomycin resistance/dioxygenase family protein [Alphaproteobacteria bacterium]